MSLWTVQQHEWLQALGHPVLLLAGDPALTVVAPVAGAEPLGTYGADGETGTKKTPDDKRPRADVAAKKAALDEARRASRSARSAALGSAQDEVLLAAVLRATGSDAPAAKRVMAALAIDLEKLRADPSAKRALWLQLRRQRGDRNR